MSRKPTGNPPGRPRNEAAEEAAAEADRKGIPVEAAARRKGAPRSTAYRAKQRRPGKGTPAKRPASPRQPPAPASPPGGSQVAAGWVAVSPRPDLLALVRRILDHRNAGARAELDEGLSVFAAGGEEALGPWLARPLDVAALEGDELDALRRALAVAAEVLGRAEPGEATLKALGKLVDAAKSVSVVAARRPREEGPDEVTRRLVEAEAGAIERIGLLVHEAINGDAAV